VASNGDSSAALELVEGLSSLTSEGFKGFAAVFCQGGGGGGGGDGRIRVASFCKSKGWLLVCCARFFLE